ncbi:MAG: phosphatidylserine decarboxylase [Halarcobacter sp.]
MFDSVIAKEGQKAVGISFIAMIISILIECGFLVFITFVLTLFLIYIFRNKQINFNNNTSDIVAPISGVITAIDTIDNKKEIFIDVSLCSNHILRAVEDGDYEVTYNRGLNLNLSSYKAKKLNEKAIIKFANSTLNLYSSMYNIAIDVTQTNSLRKCEKIGIFLQGQITVTIENTNHIVVKIGDKVSSGETTLAILPTKEGEE